MKDCTMRSSFGASCLERVGRVVGKKMKLTSMLTIGLGRL